MAELRGKGTVLQVEISSVFTTITQLTKISGFTASVDTSETTDLSDSAKTYLGTMPDYGSISFEINYDPDDTTHSHLTSNLDGSSENWKLVLTDSTPSTWAFSGPITKFEIGEINASGHVTASCEVKISGAATKT